MTQPKDPLRSGVKATKIPWSEPPMYLENDRWFGPPGAYIGYDVRNETYSLCCPGCGELGGPREGAKWIGWQEDVTTMTLRPSIAKSCCGWHGYLNCGVFELQPK